MCHPLPPITLTPFRHRLATTVEDFIDRHGHAPSVRELSVAMNRAPSTVHHHLMALESLGVIRRRRGRARTIVVNSQLLAH